MAQVVAFMQQCRAEDMTEGRRAAGESSAACGEKAEERTRKQKEGHWQEETESLHSAAVATPAPYYTDSFLMAWRCISAANNHSFPCHHLSAYLRHSGGGLDLALMAPLVRKP